MNSLTRRVDETLCIGPNIRITVLGIKGQQVRLGITEPKNIAVDREEIYARKQHEVAAAASAATPPVPSAP